MFAQIMLSKIDQNSNNSSVFFVSMNVKGMTENIYEYNSDFYDYKFKFVDVKITSVGPVTGEINQTLSPPAKDD